jgi:hypothetical protein
MAAAPANCCSAVQRRAKVAVLRVRRQVLRVLERMVTKRRC